MRRLVLLLVMLAPFLMAPRTDNTGAPTTGAVGIGFGSTGTITGTWTWADEIAAEFGTDSDWRIYYNEAGDDQFIFSTSKAGAQETVDDPMFLILVDDLNSERRAEGQLVFGIAAQGAIAAPFELFSVNLQGDVNIVGAAIFNGVLDIGFLETFNDTDSTPLVSGSSYWETGSSASTITDFDGVGSLRDGQILYVKSNAATTYDCTGAGLLCGSTDLVQASGDVTGWLYNGTDWELRYNRNQSIDNNLSAYLHRGGGTMSGDIVFPDNINATFGTDLDTTISHNDTNFLIDNRKGYTDLTGALFAAEDEDVYSRFGGAPTHLNPSDTIDKLVVRKERTVNSGQRRAFAAILDLNYNSSITGRQNYAFNAFVYTDELSDGGNIRTAGVGGAVAGRYGFRHLGAGTFAMAGGVSSFVEITDDAESEEDGTVTVAYAYLDEGGDGGAGSGEITDYYGLLIKQSDGNVRTKTGIYIEPLIGATVDSIGIRIDEVSTYALWLGAGGTFTAPSQGITFGSGADVNLYRSADNTLKTDSSLIIGQGISVDVETITGTSVTLGADDYAMLIDDDTAGSTVTITLPAAASNAGRVYHIKKLGTTANVVVDGNTSETIDGATTLTMTIQYESIKLVCDGSNWSII